MSVGDAIMGVVRGDVVTVAATAAEALGRGDTAAAEKLCRRGLEDEDHGELHFVLGAAAFLDDQLEEACREWEAAYLAFHQDGVSHRAARMATQLGELHWGGLGKEATGRGWLERARRSLETAGPCVEWGYWELARLACDRADVEALAASADRALEIAARYGDTGLHVRALVDSGVALVTSGAVSVGLARLDEALACISAGEVADPYIMGTSFCGLLTAAERVGDVERVMEWLEAIRKLLLDPTGGRPGVLRTHCSIALGGVLVHAGRWPEAEQLLQASLAHTGPSRLTHRVDAVSRLADLRVRQGRADEAAELLALYEDHLAAAAPLAAVHLANGDAALAAAVTTRALDQLVGDALRSAPLLLLLVDAELGSGNVNAAGAAACRLRDLAEAGETPILAAMASLTTGRVSAARGQTADAVGSFEDAIRALAEGGRPDLLAVAHLDLAGAQAALGNRDAAIAAARAAHAGALRLAAPPLRDQAASMLRQLGASAPRLASARTAVLAELTPREREVLDGLRRGQTNAEIAARLYLSPKTVEHHVSRLLTKLDARSRAEAVAVAAAAESLDGVTDPR
jgi:DNA-binding NarL/FixJ family response regulator